MCMVSLWWGSELEIGAVWGGGYDPEDWSVWGLCRCEGRRCLEVQGLPHHEDTIHIYTYRDYTT